jgi:photosystem II stability/assembly factor-like uncharacterized protein
MQTLLIATRKGLFVATEQDGHWSITGHHFAGEPVSQALADPRDGRWYVALRLGHFGVKFWSSADRGMTWHEGAAPAFPPKPDIGPWTEDTTPWTLDMIWTLEAGGADEPGVLWAGCLPAGLFRSADHGATWTLVESLWLDERRLGWFGGGYDHAGIHSIVVDPRNSQHLTLAVSCGGVWQTRDAGSTWELTAKGMRASFMPPERLEDGNIQDVHRMVQCAAAPDTFWVQHHCGIYRSTDGAMTWQQIAAPAPSDFGFAVACDPHDPQRAWFVPAKADQCRIPVDGKVVVNRTDDGGTSFTTLGHGLPDQRACHLVYRHGLEVTADGRTLAMGSTTGAVWISSDAGETWTALSRDLPPVAALRFVGE